MKNSPRVLAIRPMGRGFGYALTEGPGRLLDWGFKEERVAAVEQSLKKVKKLVASGQPDLLVMEDLSGGRRSPRAHELVAALEKLGEGMEIKIKSVSKRAAKHNLDSNSPIKQYRLARLVARRFPQLNSRLPPPRKAWMSQDPRYTIFEAVALALASYPRTQEDQLEEESWECKSLDPG